MDPDLAVALSVTVSPDTLYRELVAGRGGPVSTWIDARFDVLARPGEAPHTEPEAEDLLIRVALGEPGLGHVAVLADSGLLSHTVLDQAGIRAEHGGPGFYATVIEGGAFPHDRSDRSARRVLDRTGRMPPGQVLLRPKPPPQLDQESNGRTAGQPTFCEQARAQAQADDPASTRLIELLKRPIGSDRQDKLARRVQELTELFRSLDPSQRVALRARLNDPADALGRLFDCELHHATRTQLRGLLDAPPAPAPMSQPTPQPAPALGACRREQGTMTTLLPWERSFLALVNDRSSDEFRSMTLVIGPVFHPMATTAFHRLIVPLALRSNIAITIESNVWFRDALDTSRVGDLATLVHESVHLLDYALVGTEAFLQSYVMKAVVARFEHDKIPDERRANRVERAALRMLGRFPGLVKLIGTCDNDAIVAELERGKAGYRAAMVKELADDGPAEAMEPWDQTGVEDLDAAEGSGDLDYDSLLNSIRQEEDGGSDSLVMDALAEQDVKDLAKPAAGGAATGSASTATPATIGFEFDLNVGLWPSVFQARKAEMPPGSVFPPEHEEVTTHTWTDTKGSLKDGFRVKRDGPRLEIATIPIALHDNVTFDTVVKNSIAFAKELEAQRAPVKTGDRTITDSNVSGFPVWFTHLTTKISKLPLVIVPRGKKTALRWPSDTEVWAAPQATITIELGRVSELVLAIDDSVGDGLGKALSGGRRQRLGEKSDLLVDARKSVLADRGRRLGAVLSDGSKVSQADYSDSVTGLLILMTSYMLSGERIDPDDYETYAKGYLPLNVKAPFRDLFREALSDRDRKVFKELYFDVPANFFALAKPGATDATGNTELFPPKAHGNIDRLHIARPTWKTFLDNTVRNLPLLVTKDNTVAKKNHKKDDEVLFAPLTTIIPFSKTKPRVAIEMRRIGFARHPHATWKQLMVTVRKLATTLNP